MALSKKRQAFVEHYLRCWNATEAARRAGYAHPNKQGPRLLVNVGIQAAIQARLDELKMSADEVLLRLADQARGIPADCFEIYGSLISVNFEKLRDYGLMHLVKKVSYDTEGRPRVEFYDAQAALVQIGRHHKLFTDRTEIPGLDALKAYIGVTPDEWDEVEDGDGAPGAG